MCLQRTICEAVVQKCFFFLRISTFYYVLLKLYLLFRGSLEKMHPICRGIFLQVVKEESGNDKNSMVKKLFVNKCTTITQFDRNLQRLFGRYYVLEHFANPKIKYIVIYVFVNLMMIQTALFSFIFRLILREQCARECKILNSDNLGCNFTPL